MDHAITRFTKQDINRLVFEEDDFLITVVFILGSWQWTVWEKGAPLEGRRHFDMDAYAACEEALKCIRNNS